VPGHVYTSYPVSLGPGDSLIVYTDGIEDAQPASGQRFTEDGVCKTIQDASRVIGSLSAREIGNRIVQEVQKHVGNHPQFDDIALVCFGRALNVVEVVEVDDRPTRAQ
jgi:sigma-B regulation protein RsbU (phosphoserine phosphatase)